MTSPEVCPDVTLFSVWVPGTVDVWLMVAPDDVPTLVPWVALVLALPPRATAPELDEEPELAPELEVAPDVEEADGESTWACADATMAIVLTRPIKSLNFIT